MNNGIDIITFSIFDTNYLAVVVPVQALHQLRRIRRVHTEYPVYHQAQSIKVDVAFIVRVHFVECFTELSYIKQEGAAFLFISEEPKAKKSKSKGSGSGQLFTLKKWNAVAMWSWDVECDTCAICRVQVMGELVTAGIA